MRMLIRNGKLLIYEKPDFQIREGSIETEGSRISRILPSSAELSEAAYDRVIDASGMLVMPGLINSHTHSYMSLMRNFADDLDFFDWLEKVQTVEDHLTPEDCYWGTMLNIVEMIRTGTTTFVDMPIRSTAQALTGPEGTTSAAVNDSGMRAWLGRGMVGEAEDADSQRRFREFFREMELYEGHDRIRFLLGPHATYSCERSLLEKIRSYAVDLNMIVNIHIAESETETETIASRHDGMTPTEYIASSGLFDVPVIAAHCVNLSDHDFQILQQAGASIAINPRSNMKLGNGFAPADRMLREGINVCIGTDSSASNNTQNLFQEMQAAALIYKGKEKKSRCVDAQDVLRFATLGGAKALGMEGELGVIAPGALADVILIDLQVPQFIPANHILSGLVYSSNGSEVQTVIVNGRILMENRKILTVDEKQVYRECQRITKRLGMEPEL